MSCSLLQSLVPGFRETKPMVFTGLYPTDSDDYGALKTALEKLQLNDSSIVYEPESVMNGSDGKPRSVRVTA